MILFDKLSQLATELQLEFDQIPQQRKERLEGLAAWVRSRRQKGDPASVTFVCAHNSRRSHLGQAWAHAAAAVYNVRGVATFSGGTEATACNPRTIAAMRRAGFQVITFDQRENPRYITQAGPTVQTQTLYSKLYNDEANPQEAFAAVMTCSHADEDCPLIPGVERFAILYEDPKAHDDTPREAAAYDIRLRQIGREMLYAFSVV